MFECRLFDHYGTEHVVVFVAFSREAAKHYCLRAIVPKELTDRYHKSWNLYYCPIGE